MGAITVGMSTVAAAPTNVNKTLTASYTDSDTTDTFTWSLASAQSTPSAFTVSSTTNATTTLTTTANFNKVRKGDGVSGTGIPSSTTVASISHVSGTDTKSLVLSNAATNSATNTITFTPAAPTGEIFVVQGSISPQSSATGASDRYQLTVDVYVMDGKNQATTNPSVNDAVKAGSVTAVQHFPTFESNVART